MPQKDEIPKTGCFIFDLNSLVSVRARPGSGTVGLESCKGRLDARGTPRCSHMHGSAAPSRKAEAQQLDDIDGGIVLGNAFIHDARALVRERGNQAFLDFSFAEGLPCDAAGARMLLD